MRRPSGLSQVMTIPRQLHRAAGGGYGQQMNTAQQAGTSDAARKVVLAGWAAKGVVYLALAYLVLQMAFGSASEQASSTGALQKIAQTAPGKVTLAVLGVGLLAFAVGRVLEVTTLARPEIAGKDKAVAAVLAVVYTSLALTAFSIVGLAGGASTSGGGGSSSEQQGSTFLFGLPGGRYLVGLLGLVVIGLGVFSVVKGGKQAFLPTLRTGEMSSGVRSATTGLGVAAYVTKGVIFGLVGYFFVQAAVGYDPQAARGLDAALREVAEQSWGQIALVLIAIGLLAYALFSFVEARFREVGSSATGTA